MAWSFTSILAYVIVPLSSILSCFRSPGRPHCQAIAGFGEFMLKLKLLEYASYLVWIVGLVALIGWFSGQFQW